MRHLQKVHRKSLYYRVHLRPKIIPRFSWAMNQSSPRISHNVSRQNKTESERPRSGTGHKFPLIRESEMSGVIEVNMTGVQHRLGLSLIQP